MHVKLKIKTTLYFLILPFSCRHLWVLWAWCRLATFATALSSGLVLRLCLPSVDSVLSCLSCLLARESRWRQSACSLKQVKVILVILCRKYKHHHLLLLSTSILSSNKLALRHSRLSYSHNLNQVATPSYWRPTNPARPVLFGKPWGRLMSS